jgi:hypothetical protein
VPEIPEGLLRDQQTQERLNFVWKQTAKAQNNSGIQAVDELIGFLRQNGQNISAEQKLKISDFCDDFWCSLEPDRCRGRKPRGEEIEEVIEQSAAPGVKLPWALSYWQTFNRMLASDSDDAASQVDAMAKVGIAFLAGEQGCPTCLTHWKDLLEMNPPVALIKSSRHARAWTYWAHNKTRENQPPTPWEDVQIGWHWPRMTGDEVVVLLTEMGLS